MKICCADLKVGDLLTLSYGPYAGQDTTEVMTVKVTGDICATSVDVVQMGGAEDGNEWSVLQVELDRGIPEVLEAPARAAILHQLRAIAAEPGFAAKLDQTLAGLEAEVDGRWVSLSRNRIGPEEIR